jgi:hypothetical protein
VGKQSGRKTEKWKQRAMKMEKTGNKGGKTEVGAQGCSTVALG